MTQTLTLSGTAIPVSTHQLAIGSTASWACGLALTYGPGVFSLAFVRDT